MNNNTITIDLDKCFECGEPKQDMHHVIPKSKGGKKMIPLCAKCHGLVHGKDFVKHRTLLLEGIKRAKELGKYKGRKKGTTHTIEEIIIKYIDVVEQSLTKKSLRKIAKITNKSLGTVQKIKKVLNDIGEETITNHNAIGHICTHLCTSSLPT
jgi:hypothetical protein